MSNAYEQFVVLKAKRDLYYANFEGTKEFDPMSKGSPFLAALLVVVGFHIWSNCAEAQTRLTSGVPFTGTLQPVANPTLFTGFYVDVPSGTGQLVIRLAASANADLFARFNEDLVVSSGQVVFDYASRSPTGNETISINAPQTGKWYVALAAIDVNVSITFSLTATISSLSTTNNSLVVPQFVNGAGWSTTLFLTNVSDTAETFTLKFFDDSGAALFVPLLELGSVSSVSGSLNPGQTLIYQTTNTAGTVVPGWALITPATTNVNRINGFAIFRQRGSTSDNEAVVNLGTTTDQSVTMLYDQSNGFSTGLALVNPGSTTATLSVTIRDESGAAIGNGTITLAPNGHQAAFVPERFPITVDKRGSLVITSPTGFSVLGLRFSPFGPFTSFPPLK